MDSRKRSAPDAGVVGHAAKRPRVELPAKSIKPRIAHATHPASGCGENFHDVPYPLSLLPLDSWRTLHENEDWRGMCARCRKPRPFSAHERKLFLVAERLSWADQPIPQQDRELNDINLWSVNADLGIVDPAIEDAITMPGGQHSRTNCWHPYASEADAASSMSLVKTAGVLTDDSFALWSRMIAVKRPLLPPPRPPSPRAPYSGSGIAHPVANEDVARFANSTVTCVQARLVQMRLLIAIRAHRLLTDVAKCASANESRASASKAPTAKASAPQLPSGAIISLIADRAASDPALKRIVQAVSKATATQEQLREFQKHVVELTAIQEANDVAARHKAVVERRISLVRTAEADLTRLSKTVAGLEGLASHSMGQSLHNTRPDYTPVRGSMLLSFMGFDRMQVRRNAETEYSRVLAPEVDDPHLRSLQAMAETVTAALLPATDAPGPSHRADTWAELEQYLTRLLAKAAETDEALEDLLRQYRQDAFAMTPEAKARLRSIADHCVEHCEKLDPIVPDTDMTGLLTPESSAAEESVSHVKLGTATRTLIEFYSQLDKLERLSPMAATYLEAYATRLRDELCNDCWFEHNVLSEEQLASDRILDAHPDWNST